MHNNKITSLPDSFADLTALTHLDISYNALEALPTNLFALPNLTTLNISHNRLSSLPFYSPFQCAGANPLARTKDTRGDWFSQSITRATTPLPRVVTLDASHNHITAARIDHEPGHLPALVSKLDLSANPLGRIDYLVIALSRLERLSELRLEHSGVADDSFPVTLFSSEQRTLASFPQLKLIDLGETHVTRAAIEAAFSSIIKKKLDFELTSEEPHIGTLRVILGKKVIKEAWEIEAERRANAKKHAAANSEDGLHIGSRRVVAGGSRERRASTSEPVKEVWELETEQGLLTEGARRRARATAHTANQPVPTSDFTSAAEKLVVTKPAEKEAWEIEAEQGLLTEGAKRRARAAAMAAAKKEGVSNIDDQTSRSPTSSSSAGPATVLTRPQFYSSVSQTLTLPPSAPPRKAAHARSFSLMPQSSALAKASENSDLFLGVPTPTLPLNIIAIQPYAQTLKILILANRRNDPSFSLSDTPDGMSLPSLEELSLEGCNLSDTVPVSKFKSSSTADEPLGSRQNEPILPLLARLFPTLRSLDLSYNVLTSTALTRDALTSLILATTEEDNDHNDNDNQGTLIAQKGIRQLRLRGNKLTDLDGFMMMAEMFKGHRDVPGWKIEELDLRDNEINRLPPELGLLPMEVFLVDGNTYVL